MELPSIGKHCSDSSCSQLDFLPFTCPYCKKIFCQDHWRLETHVCPNKDAATQQDRRVPICPLCDKPVPVKNGEDPNLRMEQHIVAGCPEPATTISKPIYTNSCNFKSCKNRSAIPIVCQKCRLNYCLKHRLEGDHACAGVSKAGPGGGGKGGAAARSKPNGGSAANGSNRSSHKTTNTSRNVQAATAAESRAATSSGGNRPSAGQKDKDKCLIS